MRKQRMNLEVGKKYRGYGYLNEFGEFEFTPEQKGARQGQRKLLKEGDQYTISETTHSLVVHLTIPRKHRGIELLKEYMKLVNNVLVIIRDYDI